MRRMLTLLALASVGIVSTITTAFADQVFHSTRLTVMPIGDNSLSNGDVVDIHTDGLINYAIEVYHLIGAAPNTTYSVVYQISGAPFGTPVCGGSTVPFPNGATVTTDAQGNGQGQLKIAPSFIDLLGLHGQTLGLSWQFVANGAPAYETDCISVGLD